MDASLISYLAHLGTVAAALVAVVSIFFIKRQIAISTEVAVWSAVAAHNKDITDDPAKMLALSYSFGFQAGNEKLRESLATEEIKFQYWELYWATRALMLSHMNLLTQVWLLSAEEADYFEENMNGWAWLARHVYLHTQDEIDPDTGKRSLNGKPNWYADACRALRVNKADSAGSTSRWEKYVQRVITMKEDELKAKAAGKSVKLSLKRRVGMVMGVSQHWHR
jgi:hypothetical protein